MMGISDFCLIRNNTTYSQLCKKFILLIFMCWKQIHGPLKSLYVKILRTKTIKNRKWWKVMSVADQLVIKCHNKFIRTKNWQSNDQWTMKNDQPIINCNFQNSIDVLASYSVLDWFQTPRFHQTWYENI